MLVRLYGSNFRSFKGKFELSMVAADLKREEDRHRGVIEVPITGMSEPLQLLRTVAIYGPNASGKSTALLAAHALRWLATDSSPQSKPGSKIPPYEPFSLDSESKTSPIELGCDVVYKNSILRYEISYVANAILRETLSVLNQNRETKLIERNPSGEIRGSLISRSDANRLYVKEMQPNVSVLSKLAQHGPHKGKESVQPYYKTIRNATRHEDYSAAAGLTISLPSTKDERFADDAEYREWIMNHLIRPADVGICDVNTRRENFTFPIAIKEEIEKSGGGFKFPDSRVIVSFLHQGSTVQAIDFSDESSGTKKLFNIAGDWWILANKPITLLADELSASLHPKLLDRLVRAVNDAPTDRVRSQLIFTTHDAGLLESCDGQPPALRRDQVYFAKKNSKGESELYSLAEFKDEARPVHNIRKRYLSGMYGAIPGVEKLSL
ncbi:AAA family ATPase [Zavarzinella formosa]|uniref:AAA family ATPase n=1 Tax=Zavarzinella formosa TaxID=360055 RepID=UPI0002DD7B0D|nr:ATP-binding protein [Zavarzinella formosa]